MLIRYLTVASYFRWCHITLPKIQTCLGKNNSVRGDVNEAGIQFFGYDHTLLIAIGHPYESHLVTLHIRPWVIK